MTIVKSLALFIGVILAGILLTYNLENQDRQGVFPSLPKCQEDEYIQGYGNFTHGTWSEYRCAHDNR